MYKIMDMAIWPINKLIHNALQLDAESTRKLVPLAGKVVAIELTGPQQTFFIQVEVDSLRLSFNYSGTPHTTLIGTPFAFLRLLLQQPAGSLSSEIALHGDVHFIQQLQQIISGLSIDWEEQLAKFTGDGIAHQLGRFSKDLQQWLKAMQTTLCTNTKEYLQQEHQQLPEPQAVQDFVNAVDILRNDVERLAVRIKNLKD